MKVSIICCLFFFSVNVQSSPADNSDKALEIDNEVKSTKHIGNRTGFIKALLKKRKYKQALRYLGYVKNKSDDHFYYLGVANLGLKKYIQSINSFNKTIKSNKRVVESYYNLGELYLEQKKYMKALESYMKAETALGMFSKNTHLLQLVVFRQATSLYSLNSSDSDYVLDRVINKLEYAKRIYPTSNLSKRISLNIAKLRQKFNLFHQDGAPVKSRKFKIRANSAIKYNSNVIEENEISNVGEASNNDSFIFTNAFDLQYSLSPVRNFLFDTSLKFSSKSHSKSSEPQIVSNDDESLKASIKLSFLSKLVKYKLKSTIGFNLTTKNKDYNSEKTKRYYGKVSVLSVGERLKINKKITTSFNYVYSSFSGYKDDINSKGHTFLFIPQLTLSRSLKAIIVGQYSNSDSSTDSNDKRTFKGKISLIRSKIFPSLTASLFTGLTRDNYYDETSNRDSELTLQVGSKAYYRFQIHPFFEQKSILSADYSYTKRKAQVTNYSYDSHAFGLDIAIRF